MINLPPIRRMSPASTTVTDRNRQTSVTSTASTSRRQAVASDRRYRHDRRTRRGEKQVMDRRTGMDRRRSAISFKV